MEGKPRELVLDTSVAVKFYLPEESREEALRLLASVGTGGTKLLAPSTIQPELLNALFQQYRRGGISIEEVEEYWRDFSFTAIDLYAPEDLMPRAAEIMLETGVIVYDALFLALAEAMDTTAATADDKLIRAVKNTPYSRLAKSLAEWTSGERR